MYTARSSLSLNEVLPSVLDWSFDTISVHRLTGSKSLTYITEEILKACVYYPNFAAEVFRVLGLAESDYNPSTGSLVAYHNIMHGSDVCQALLCMLLGPRLLLDEICVDPVRRELVLISSIFAASLHDYDHPGVTNSYLIETRSPLAIQYADLSVLENYHAVCALSLVDFEALGLSKSESVFFRKLVIEMILSTDLAKHETVLANSDISMCSKMCFALHCADVSNTARNPQICSQWTHLICEEFMQQAKLEKATPPKYLSAADQIAFVDNICFPLYIKLALPECLENLQANRKRWIDSTTLLACQKNG